MGAPNATLKTEGLFIQRIKCKSKAHAVELEFVYDAHSNRPRPRDKPL